MSIENCPLSQIPSEIVTGGPSLVIQVCSVIVKLINKISFQIFILKESRDCIYVEKKE